MGTNFYCYLIENQIIKILRPLPLVMILLLLTSISYGQTGKGTISGHIADSTGNPIPAAAIQLEGTSLGTTSDVNGDFRLQNVEEGGYIIIVSILGYTPEKRTIHVEADKTTQLSLKLRAEILEMEEVVITVGNNYKKDNPSSTLRINQPLIEVPQNITVVSNEVIKEQQLLTLSEIERNVSGVTTNLPYPGVYTDFMIRGSRGETNKFRNGIQSANGTQLMEDMSFVESVEFVKGPAGFMISQGEPGGIYNVYTKKPVRRDIKDATFTYGSFNLFRGAIDLGGSFKRDGKLLYRLNAMGQRSRTHIDYDYNNRFALAPVLAYEISNKTKLTAEYNFQQAFIGIVEPSVFAQKSFTSLPVNFTYYDPSGDGVKITDHTIYLNMEHYLSANWKLTAQTGYSHGRWYGNRFDFGFGPTGIVDSAGNMYRTYELRDINTKSISGQVFVNGKINTGKLSHDVILGLDANNYSLSNVSDAGSVPTINIYNPTYGLPLDSLPDLSLDGKTPYRESANYSALYVQDMITLFGKLRITLAGRYTSANILSFDNATEVENESAFSPRAGISYSIKPDWAVYALYDQSFIPQAGSSVSGEKFKPLRGNNIEGGIKKDWFERTVSTNLSIYHITKINKLTGDPLNPGFEIQRGEIQSKGLEFDMIGRTKKGVSVVFNYAYTDSRITEDTDENVKGQRVDGVAKHATNLWVRYQFQNTLLKGLAIGLGGRYLKDRAAQTGYIDVTQNKFPTLDDWKQLDASLSYELNNFYIALNVNNITNQKNYTGLPVFDIYYTQYSAPINYRLSATVKF